jgi:4-hydroxybenzoate polyprenyltransferase
MARKSSALSIRQLLGYSSWLNNDISSLLGWGERIEETLLFTKQNTSERDVHNFQRVKNRHDSPWLYECTSGFHTFRSFDKDGRENGNYHPSSRSSCIYPSQLTQHQKIQSSSFQNDTGDNTRQPGGLKSALQPYMMLSRMDKPIGTWLLAWPSFWSISIAAPPGGPLDISTLALFGMGAFLLRGAGCTINDMWDRDFDKMVERTKSRPLAAGTITQWHALGWLGIQLSAGLAILLQLHPYSQLIGVASLPFVATYPLMKRVTGWPQAFLGLTINWGAIMGWAAVHDSLDWNVVGPLYMSGFFWTLLYDTIYAHQDKTDDVKAGVKSTALTFGKKTKSYLTAFAVANIACVTTSGIMAGCQDPFFVGVAAAAGQLAWQISTVDLDNPKECGKKFKSNWWYGFFIFSGIVSDKFIFLT